MRTRAATLAAVLCLGLGVAALAPALPASAKSISTPNLKALSNALAKGKHLTYYAQYTAVSGGERSTVTIAQAPPKTYFSGGSGAVINTGKATYYCGTSSTGNSGGSGNSGTSGTGSSGNSGSTSSAATSAVHCVAQKGTSAASGLEDLFSPTIALSALSEAENSVLARALGVKVSSSSATFAGQPSTCVTVTVRGKTGKYCVTKQGLLSYSGTSKSQYFQLTKYQAKPSATQFTLPAGATTQTIPQAGTTP